jgi:nitroreductase
MSAIQFVHRGTGIRVGPRSGILARAATDALAAPSIFNSQPWRWLVSDDAAELRADRTRQLVSLDPDGRLLTLSCGAALHHARTALTAAGVSSEVTRLPDAADPDLLAIIGLGAPVEPQLDDLRRYRAISLRRTDRRPFADLPVPPDALDPLQTAAEEHGAHLHFPKPASVVSLAVAAGHAATRQLADPAYHTDRNHWVHQGPGDTDGVPPDTTGPAAARPVQMRDFTADRPQPTAVADPPPLADRYARYAILFTDTDDPLAWLAAGEALSAVLLTATMHGLAISPMSDLVEVPESRRLLRDLLAGIGHPAIVLRIGLPGSTAPAPAAPRRTAAEAVELTDGDTP